MAVMYLGKHIDSYDVFGWPEYEAFAKRLGIAVVPDMKVVITLQPECMPIIEHTYAGKDKKE
jgi:hypothetical protein